MRGDLWHFPLTDNGISEFVTTSQAISREDLDKIFFIDAAREGTLYLAQVLWQIHLRLLEVSNSWHDLGNLFLVYHQQLFANVDSEVCNSFNKRHDGSFWNALQHVWVDHVPQLLQLLLVAPMQAGQPAESEKLAHVVSLILRAEIWIEVDHSELTLLIAVHLISVEHNGARNMCHVLVC